jgi:signal transduction histidine kinase
MILEVGLGSWLFMKRGACVCFFGFMASIIIYNVLKFHAHLWPLLTILAFFDDMIILFIVASATVALRYMFEAEEEARQKAEEGERQKEKAYEKLQQLNQIKTQFIMNVNHELRTPLAAAYGYFELLQVILEQNGILEQSTHAPYIQSALQYCEELRTMVNNVLETIDIWSTKKPPHIEGCLLLDAAQIIMSQVEALKQEQHRIYIYIPSTLAVRANMQYLCNIFHQLLTNAVKFTRDPSPIVVYAIVDDVEPQKVYITVQDFGIGIPPEEIPALFHQFTRLERDIAGTIRGIGQGLYICKQLVEAMGGRIWIESTGHPGHGTSVRFTLPQATAVHQCLPLPHSTSVT